MFDILYIVGNSPLSRIGKILAMGHDPSARMRDIRLFENSSYSTRSGGGKDKMH